MLVAAWNIFIVDRTLPVDVLADLLSEGCDRLSPNSIALTG
jgi:hypothetical protein